jgi:hypothetical protein
MCPLFWRRGKPGTETRGQTGRSPAFQFTSRRRKTGYVPSVPTFPTGAYSLVLGGSDVATSFSSSITKYYNYGRVPKEMTYATVGMVVTRIMMVVVPVVLGASLVVSYALGRGRRSGWLLFYAAICVGLAFLGSRGLAHQMRGHSNLTSIDPSQVLSVSILGRTFVDHNAVSSIVFALKSSSWFGPSDHTAVKDEGDIEIHTRTGQTIRYRIGRIHGGHEFLIHDSGFDFQDVNKELVSTLEKLP